MTQEPERNAGESRAANAAPRKPYSTPALRVFGDVAALTRKVGRTSTHADGGTGNMSKTH